MAESSVTRGPRPGSALPQRPQADGPTPSPPPCQALAEILRTNRTVTRIDLKNNEIGEEGAKARKNSPKATDLHHPSRRRPPGM